MVAVVRDRVQADLRGNKGRDYKHPFLKMISLMMMCYRASIVEQVSQSQQASISYIDALW